MSGLRLVLAVSLLIGVGECLPCRFLWPSFFSSSKTTITHARPSHPAGITPMIAQPHSSPLQVRPGAGSSYLENRPRPPLVMGAHHHHHHLRPMVGPNTHLPMHGGAIAGTDHQHHYHLNQQQNHHHHSHISRPLLFNAHSTVPT